MAVHLNCYQPLYYAALRGDWEAAKKNLEANPNAATAKITRFSRTALHVAAFEGHSDFVEKLVQLMPVEALEMVDEFDQTALHYAGFSGILQAAIPLVKKNPKLTSVVDKQGWTPLLRACVLGFTINKDLIWYLFLVNKDDGPGRPYPGPFSYSLVEMLVGSGHRDILQYLLEHYTVLVIAPNNPDEGSQHLDQDDWPLLLTRLVLRIIRQMIPSTIKQLKDAKITYHCAVELVRFASKQIGQLHGSLLLDCLGESLILESAACKGITEIIKIKLQFFPDLLWTTEGDRLVMLHVAIEHRREDIFNILCKTYGHLKFTSGDNMFCIKLRKWFLIPNSHLCLIQHYKCKENFSVVQVWKLINPTLTNLEDKNGRNPREVFTKEHKALVEAGEKWMKDTSKTCMIVSTLIALFVFAVAFNAPEGYDYGVPNIAWNPTFMIFVISDALALFSSITSLLMFFSILTAPYTEEDFHVLLPKKLIIGTRFSLLLHSNHDGRLWCNILHFAQRKTRFDNCYSDVSARPCSR